MKTAGQWRCISVWILVLALATMLAVVQGYRSKSRPYEGYQVLAIKWSGNSRKVFARLMLDYDLDVWGLSSGYLDVMIRPSDVNDIIQHLNKTHVKYFVKIANVQSMLDAERKKDRHIRSLSASSVGHRYLRFPQIRQFLQQVQQNATQADVTLSSLGRSFENRQTPYVLIREKNSQMNNKSVFIIDAGIHAREWIAPAMAINIINKLAFNPDNDSDVPRLLEKLDWIIIPVINPDGYVYSFRNASTRLWRKTRTSMYTADADCLGVDGNRNFGFQWSNSPARGGSRNPCMDNFSGPGGFSEPETQNLRALLQANKGHIAAYVSLHSYGQFFLYPWGYDAAADIEDEQDLMEVGRLFRDTMWEKNRWYEVGSAAKVLYAAAGASDDYARGGAGIKYAFTIELSPPDSSPHGFLLPTHHISSVVADHWPAFKAVAFKVWEKIHPNASLAQSLDADLLTDTLTQSAGNSALGEEDHEDDVIAPEAETDVSLSRPASTSTRSDALSEITVDGQTYLLDLRDPMIMSWVQYYMSFLEYRRQFSGDWSAH